MVCQDYECVGGSTLGEPILPGTTDDLLQNCSNKAGGLIIGSPGVKEECNFWCKLGLKKPVEVNTCVYDYTLLIVVIVGMFLLFVIGMYSINRNGGNGSGKSFFQKKGFWISLLVLGLGLVLWRFWAYAVWIGLGALALLILLRITGVFDVLKLMRGKRR